MSYDLPLLEQRASILAKADVPTLEVWWAHIYTVDGAGQYGSMITPQGHFTVMRSVERGVRNVLPGRYECKMVTLPGTGERWLWFGERVYDGNTAIRSATRPAVLRLMEGALSPGLAPGDAGLQNPADAMREMFEALGGFVEGKHVRVIVHG